MTFSEFKRNGLVVDAVIRNFEVIGEASKNVPLAIRRTHPDIPWAQMNGMRNLLIHEYFGVDVKTVWHTAKKYLPALKKRLKHLCEKVEE